MRNKREVSKKEFEGVGIFIGRHLKSLESGNEPTLVYYIYDYSGEQIEEIKKSLLEKVKRNRKIICFDIINRGSLWFDTLTAHQKEQLGNWYHQWLNITDTINLENDLESQYPIIPEWLDEK